MLGKVDHTQLKAFATWEDIQKLCDEAIQYHTASVCVPPCYIKRIHDTYGDKINICTVVGFPLGYSVTEAKVAEVRKALEDGCNEIDMVVNISDVKNGLLDKVEEEIRTLKKECGHHILKVIIETCYLTEEEKIDYTLILKGHIALAMAKFPTGTRGAQLDILARMPIWQHKMNFLHGTGHGVGHFLSVHEGPQSIRMNENPVILQPGMVTSNEPGVYKAGSHGIRTENLTLVRKAGEGMFGDYLEFETITLCPICKKGIIKEMLTTEEVSWLNTYHQKVYEKLSPDLNEEEKKWLQEATAAI